MSERERERRKESERSERKVVGESTVGEGREGERGEWAGEGGEGVRESWRSGPGGKGGCRWALRVGSVRNYG